MALSLHTASSYPAPCSDSESGFSLSATFCRSESSRSVWDSYFIRRQAAQTQDRPCHCRASVTHVSPNTETTSRRLFFLFFSPLSPLQGPKRIQVEPGDARDHMRKTQSDRGARDVNPLEKRRAFIFRFIKASPVAWTEKLAHPAVKKSPVT